VKSDHRVIVVGAGPVGLICALGLARQGVPVTVLEREADLLRAPRAMGYHWSALYGLDDLGVLEEMKSRGFLVTSIDFHVRPTGETLTFSIDPLVGRVAHPYMLTLGQDRFSEVVVEHLLRHPHAELRWRTNVESLEQDAAGVEVLTAAGERLRAAYVVAADGAASHLRPLLGLGFHGLTWPDRFIATNVRYDFAKLGFKNNNYLVDPEHGAVVARVTEDGLWRVTWAENAELPDDGLENRITRFLDAVTPEGEHPELVDRSRYRMYQRAVESMRVGRVVLAGDCAHATNPTSGFGLVGGLFDSYVLTEALAAVLAGELGDEALDRYSDERLTAFWTASSPQSTESKRIVFHSQDLDRLAVDLEMLRRVSADPVLLSGFWLQGSRIESPSLVTGKLLSAGRNVPSS
jgi:3-(3-hydroxy-phenyl)propionate hydroxylase/6-hydroxy-3-succinoylpyridine 3-monooxygenase